jgi:hypothetical protein
MKRLARLAVLTAVTLASTPSLADEIAPGSTEDTFVASASNALREVLESLPEGNQLALRGMYVAVDPSRVDALLLPACDDDGDYVLVVSRAFLELLADAAYAEASDLVRGTHLLKDYGPLLARSATSGARPLPPWPRPYATRARADRAADWVGDAAAPVADAFIDDALAWLVADDVARALRGDVTCSNPSTTRERGDDEWTVNEAAVARALAPVRMTGAGEQAADDWASTWTLAHGASLVPAKVFLSVLATLEDARPAGQASTYLTFHPGSRERLARLDAAVPSARESSPMGGTMR